MPGGSRRSDTCSVHPVPSQCSRMGGRETPAAYPISQASFCAGATIPKQHVAGRNEIGRCGNHPAGLSRGMRDHSRPRVRILNYQTDNQSPHSVIPRPISARHRGGREKYRRPTGVSRRPGAALDQLVEPRRPAPGNGRSGTRRSRRSRSSVSTPALRSSASAASMPTPESRSCAQYPSRPLRQRRTGIHPAGRTGRPRCRRLARAQAPAPVRQTPPSRHDDRTRSRRRSLRGCSRPHSRGWARTIGGSGGGAASCHSSADADQQATTRWNGRSRFAPPKNARFSNPNVDRGRSRPVVHVKRRWVEHQGVVDRADRGDLAHWDTLREKVTRYVPNPVCVDVTPTCPRTNVPSSSTTAPSRELEVFEQYDALCTGYPDNPPPGFFVSM